MAACETCGTEVHGVDSPEIATLACPVCKHAGEQPAPAPDEPRDEPSEE